MRHKRAIVASVLWDVIIEFGYQFALDDRVIINLVTAVSFDLRRCYGSCYLRLF